LKNARYTALADNELVYPNMVYAGSVVTGGSASAIVCYTGKDSLLRRLAGKRRRICRYCSDMCRKPENIFP
jgi:magnesium-transporting ATPase (P-type)